VPGPVMRSAAVFTRLTGSVMQWDTTEQISGWSGAC
jgi:hypothetical protein